ncbi:hypothetical protein [Enterococcus sp. AZ072]|uniref:hypothetical protein n=1 Tax=unclassified Enterococcus TaxID=2608891 RepID=UPI003D2801BD
MALFINLLGFTGGWLLFIFPMYQAFLELSDQAITFSKMVSGRLETVKKISPLYWVLPPLKIHKEKERALIIIREMKLEANDLKKLLLYFDKATAWFYVALAGLFNSIYVTYELFGKLHLPRSPLHFFITIIVLIVLSASSVRYRLDAKRIEQKISGIRGE